MKSDKRSEQQKRIDALLARARAAESERDEYKIQRDKWIADGSAIEAERYRLESRIAELEATQRALLDRLEIQRIYAPDAEIEVQRLRAELDALKAAQQWQPVDTAPIDRPLEALLTARRSADDRWYYADVRPTAWRPLPPAPNEAEEVQP